MEQEMDIIDVLLKLGIFLSFVGFAVAIWLIKKSTKQNQKDKNDIKTSDDK